MFFFGCYSKGMKASQKLPEHGRIKSNELNALTPSDARRGRGAVSNPAGRFETIQTDKFDDGWENATDFIDEASRISWHSETARTIITRNQSPDISFDRSINPYRGCEHGCAYCFARPSHAYLGHSPGIDFERQLYFKNNAVELLRRELSGRKYEPRPIALGINTDAYQPEEKRLRLTREILRVLDEFNHPVMILTKSALIRRDIDILSGMAERGLVSTGVSMTTLKHDVSIKLEPRAAAPSLRLQTIEALAKAGIPVVQMTAPIIPCLNDSELEAMISAGADAGAINARYVLLRLPYELKDIFQEWLKAHFPDRAARVINTLRDMRGGKDYDAEWHKRQRGDGPVADLIAARFKQAVRRAGMTEQPSRLRCDLFKVPAKDSPQMSFGF